MAQEDQAAGLRRLMRPAPLRLTVWASEEEVLGAYARIKHLAATHGVREFSVVVRGAANEAEAGAVFANLRHVAERYLGVRLIREAAR